MSYSLKLGTVFCLFAAFVWQYGYAAHIMVAPGLYRQVYPVLERQGVSQPTLPSGAHGDNQKLFGARSNSQGPENLEEPGEGQDGQPRAYVERQVYEIPYPGDYRYRLVPLQQSPHGSSGPYTVPAGDPYARGQDVGGPQPPKLIYNPNQQEGTQYFYPLSNRAAPEHVPAYASQQEDEA
ncbi:uncharacterized protein LOC143196154 [Rhynchophorus ferrugineus]|uniref:uncharacterized protein LOC143196154 n=1 Tax=Rhynchophorus ferrugineus TaxID=354439 RepID=UPI003FCDDF5C